MNRKIGSIARKIIGDGHKPELIISSTEELKTSLYHKNGSVQCFVIDEKSSSCGYRNIAPKLLPERSLPVLDDGILTHYLGFDGKKLWPIDYMPSDNDDKTPQDCYEAQCWDELVVVLSLGARWMEKIQIGIIVALAVGLMIILFLISAIAMGG